MALNCSPVSNRPFMSRGILSVIVAKTVLSTEAFEYENAFKIQNEDRECKQYALVFWENGDNRDVTFNVVNAAPLSHRALQLRFSDLSGRIGNGDICLFLGRVFEVGGANACTKSFF